MAWEAGYGMSDMSDKSSPREGNLQFAQKRALEHAMAEEAESNFTEPYYSTDEKSKYGFIRVSLAVPKLKYKKKIEMKGWKPKIENEASNANVQVEFSDSTLVLTVIGESGSIKDKKYRLSIKRLPKVIIPEESYSEIKDERVILYLKKKTSESWYPDLESGLEAFEEEEVEAEEEK